MIGYDLEEIFYALMICLSICGIIILFFFVSSYANGPREISGHIYLMKNKEWVHDPHCCSNGKKEND